MEEEFIKDSRDRIPLCEEITVMKTEVKEEYYDSETPLENIKFVNVKEEYISSPVDNLTGNLGLAKRVNGNIDVRNCVLREVGLQNKKYICEFCQSDFDEEMCLKSHYEYCLSAGQNLSKEHVRIHAKDKLFNGKYNNCKCTPEQEKSCKCDTCEYEIGIKNRLNQHILLTHSAKPRKYKCGHCNYATHKKTHVVIHSYIHTGHRPLKCTYKNCKCILEQQKSCKCNPCIYAATTKSNLKMHILAQHSTQPKKYKCRDCKYATHWKGHLLQHIHIHTNKKPYKCTSKNCKYAATTKVGLNGHILMRHSAKPKSYKCRNCNYAAHRKSQLDEHARIHTSEKPFKCTYKNCKCTPEQKQSCECDECGYAAVQINALKRHILLKHSTEPKKYSCKDCKYVTHTKTDLKRHSRTHTNERPFKCTYKNCKCTPEQQEFCKCDMCGYSSIQKNNLKVHILVKHSEESKKYKCSDCKYSTHWNAHLKRHIHTHTK